MAKFSRRLEGRRALVTGGAGDIGIAIAQRLSAEGAKVVLWDKNGEGLSMIDSARDNPGFTCCVVDVLDGADVQRAAVDVLNRFGGIDIVINNAGGALGKPHRLLDVSEADWRDTIELNLLGIVRVTKAFIEGMCQAKYGRIVNIGSKAGRYSSYIDGPAYCAAKGAVHAFTLSLATEFGPKGITANAVLPGLIMTERVRTLWNSRRSMEEREAVRLAIPLQAHGDVDDVSGAVAFLASEDAKFITGVLLDLNGGQSMAT